MKRLLKMATAALVLAIVLIPDWCVDLPEFWRRVLGCSCAGGDCSGASELRPKYEPGGGRGNLPAEFRTARR